MRRGPGRPGGLQHPAAIHPQPQDPLVARLVADISPQRVERRIQAQVGFQTRHTLSETESDTRGIGAARRWIQREWEACARESDGRLQVTLDEYLERAGNRMPRAAQIVNVVATLPGTDPVSRDRLLVVSGHYDSRAGDVMDATSPAPGANDDASGVAAVMEMACVMAAHRFDATLVFLAVAGEEQGLLGATDHGHGNAMWLLGGPVAGGRVHGDWPGLDDGALYEGRDLAITPDFRRVLAGIAEKHLRLPDAWLAQVFPGWTGAAAGVLNA